MSSTPSERSNLSVVRMGTGSASVHAAVIAICGEHAHRTLGLDHWYPISHLDRIAERLSTCDLYGVLEGEILIGSFALSTEPLPYYGDLSAFRIPAERPTYLQALAILPAHQGSGVGRFAMAAADDLIAGAGGDAIRFDAVTSNTPAVGFYRRLGYAEGGVIPVGSLTVTCFERALS